MFHNNARALLLSVIRQVHVLGSLRGLSTKYRAGGTLGNKPWGLRRPFAHSSTTLGGSFPWISVKPSVKFLTLSASAAPHFMGGVVGLEDFGLSSGVQRHFLSSYCAHFKLGERQESSFVSVKFFWS
jgi:hypothetical protein